MSSTNTSGGHWYDKDAKAVYTQVVKSGNRKGLDRPTSLADARKQSLLPSVSGITGVVASEALVGYMMREVAKVAYVRQPHKGEDVAAYTNELILKSREDGATAAQLGTSVHDGLERYYSEPLFDHEPCPLTMPDGTQVDRWDFIKPAIDKIGELGIIVTDAEKNVVNLPYGYAGKTDILFTQGGNVGVLDFKSKRSKPGQKIVPYETQIMQVAAYIAAHWGTLGEESIPKNSVGYNIYISTTEVGRVEVVEYSYDELIEAWEAFKACLTIWRYKNKFDPRQ